MQKIKKCFHCGIEFHYVSNYSIIIDNEVRFMCCPGCLAVSKFIIDNNFSNYYSYRMGYNKTVSYDLFDKNVVYDDIMYQKKFIKKKDEIDYVILAIEGITCSACTWLIEHHLRKINGIYSIVVNSVTCRAHISLKLSCVKLSFLLNELAKLGYKASPYSYKRTENFNKLEYKKELKKLIVSGLCMSQVMMLSASLYVGEGRDLHYVYWNFIRWINFIITTPALLYSGADIFLSSIKNLKNKVLGMDFTISLSLILAYVVSIINLLFKEGDVYFDSICMFLFFLLIGRFLEIRARHHSNNIIYSLQELTAGTTSLFNNGNLKTIFNEDVIVNDVLLIRPGEIIPVDAEIIDGFTEIDESILTGESAPILKKKRDLVLSGTANLTNTVLIKSVKKYDDSTINVIISYLDEAFSSKPKINLVADKISTFFILFVVSLTGMTSLLWFFFTDVNIFNVILSMLVITCPCALSLAAPIAFVSSMNFLSKRGFIITKNDVLETVADITDVVFDKTGTLTLNNIVLDKVKLNSNLNLNFILTVAKLLEEESVHPISYAFKDIEISNIFNLKKKDFLNHANSGLECKINDVIYRLGNQDFIKGWVNTYVKLQYDGFYVILANKRSILAWFILSNSIRKNVHECIFNLKLFDIKTHILSGDSLDNVKFISTKIDIDVFKHNASFNDKIDYIKELQKKNKRVLMIGDGVNDAPALNVADFSVSMGSGVDLAKISADAILLNNDMLLIPIAIKHCKKLKIIIKQNIFWALLYNILGLIFAAFNLISPYYAALGMSLSSLIVVLNSLRLNRL